MQIAGLGHSAWWVRFYRSGWGFHVKTPKSIPLFSERNGYQTPLISFRGYRLFILRPIHD